ncbi:MAG TPA: hypothetical protein VM534_08870, partial [Thermoanaerobaculia bacterium]|nr:hypothetical protein [Thermoanaerobaculia bacterium]
MHAVASSGVTVRRLEHAAFDDRRALLAATRPPGAMVLEGWSDQEPWTVLLPWPETILQLSWSDIGRWREIINQMEEDHLETDPFPDAPFLGGWVGFLAYETGAGDEGASLPHLLPPEPPLFFARHRSGVLRSRECTYLFAPPDI